MAIFIISKDNKTSFLISEDEIREVLSKYYDEISKKITDEVAIQLSTEYNLPCPDLKLDVLDVEEAADKALNEVFKRIEIL